VLDGIRRAARRLRRLLTLGRVEASMEREMRAHVEFETEARMRAGATPDAARAAAVRAFGPIEAFKEAGRDARGTRAVEDAARDLRYALRSLRREPGPALSAILTFALGIGAVTAIFSVLYAVLLRPLPYDHPDRLVTLWESHPARGVEQNVVSVRMFDAWRDRAASIDALAGMVPAPVTLTDGDTAERVVGAEVSPAFFPMLGVTPLFGRTFTEDDARRGAVVVLSEELWRRRFAADPAIVGRQIHIDGRPHDVGVSHEVLGVVPATFEPPAYGWMARRQALWVPFVPTPDNRAYGRYLLVIGRLAPGAAIGDARSEVAAIAARLADDVPGSRGWSASAAPLDDVIVGDAGTALL
jgi:putative ABC transport system permease protein